MVVSVMRCSLASWSLFGELALPCRAYAGKAVHRMEQQGACDTAHLIALCLGRDVFDRRLAVYATQKQPGQQMRSARFDIIAGFPGDTCKIGLGECVEALEVACLALRPPQAFQQQVIQAE